ncbi:MAG: MSCRAMM family adhesin SdrC, partial [Phycisphaerae bacterium]|nr:MSCRAMM family adhesin SdrC [Phycisphaerae bacterium]
EQGACCLPDGTCEELFQDECEARGGTYKGDNVPCDADTCAPPTGACCLPGGDDCDENVCDNGKPKSLTFLYTGSDCRNPDNNNDQDGEFTCSDDWNSDPIPVNPVRIRVTSKRDPFDRYGKVWFDGTVYVGQEFTASAANAGQSRLYSDTYITIIDRNNYCKTYQCIHIDTSCCEELRLNDVFGSVKLVAFTTETGYSADADDCNAGGGCEELSEEECEARGGTYNGDGTECTDDTCVEPCDILCPPDVEACAACGECSVDDLDLGRPTLDGDCDGAVITNDAPDEFPIGVTIVTWTVTVGNRTSTCTQKVTVDGTICGMKWYDKDVDGVKDSNEGGINGWRIELRDANGNLVQKVYTKTIDCKEGRYEFCCVAPGTYTVLEVMPNNDWVATTPTSYTVTVGDGSCDLKRDFGNVCLGGGCARTIGYWGNSQGKSKINDGGSANPELSMLRALNLRKSDGAHFDPTGVDSFQSWLRGANATNMAYMLSAQLSAMALNVEGGYVSENDVVYAPGVGNRGPGNHFITIADLMAAADRAPGDGLGADGYTPSGDPNRAVQELRKNALDAANNNEAFVNREPCCFQSPY